jgi:hypothetical protein
VEFEDQDIRYAINNYFNNFDDINKWSEFSTEDFVRRAYFWCSGDNTNTKSLDEMKKIYYNINKNSLKLKNYYIDEYNFEDENQLVIKITRTWSNGSKDKTSYLIIKQNDSWKIDNRF